MRYSGLAVLAQGLAGNRGWRRAWRDPAPKPAYDIVIIGGGGHGLATAFYLAREHGLTNVAVLEKGYLGGGNVGRNTTIVRANYGLPGNSEFYSHSLKLWEGLEAELNYNVMHSQRGIINLFHSDGQRDAYARRGNAMINQGDDAILLDRRGVREILPYLDFEQTRFPIYGGLYHKRGGTARHDAVAWGFARAADMHGVDLIQNCEVTGIDIAGGRVTGVQTTRGPIRAKKVGIVVAGRSSQVAAMAGLRLPIESHVLQAFVTEGLKPVIDHVVTYGMGHFYISQS
ncbi:MAG: FAD-dependent oxidoreductase, partial [Roseicyclus sp.]